MKHIYLLLFVLSFEFSGRCYSSSIYLDTDIEGVSRSDIHLLKSVDKMLFAYPHRAQEALQSLLVLDDKYIDQVLISYRLGVCYLEIGEYAKSLDLLLKCDSVDAPFYYYNLGKAYHYLNDFGDAKSSYAQCKNQVSSESNKDFKLRYGVDSKSFSLDSMLNDLISMCEISIQTIDPHRSIDITHLNTLNSDQDEMHPVFFRDSILFFSSNREVDGENIWHSYEVVFDSQSVHGSSRNSSVLPDVNTLILTEVSSTGALISSNEGKIERLDFDPHDFTHIKTKALFPFFTRLRHHISSVVYLNDTTVVFSSSASKDGEKDVFISTISRDLKWSKPIPVGGEINTEAWEDVSSFYHDNLYYVSNGPGTTGGFDIFKSKYLGDNTWDTPVNVGYPLNTVNDDYGYLPIDDATGLYWGVRSEGLGGSDIYIVHETEHISTRDSFKFERILSPGLGEEGIPTDTALWDYKAKSLMQIEQMLNNTLNNKADSISVNSLIVDSANVY